MTPHVTITTDKNTGVAYVDVAESRQDARIVVVSISERLGLRSEITARIEADSGKLLGLIVEDYSAFRREIMIKYVAFRVEKIVDLIVCSVKASLAVSEQSDNTRLVHAH